MSAKSAPRAGSARAIPPPRRPEITGARLLVSARQAIERIIARALDCPECERLDCAHAAATLLDALIDCYRQGRADAEAERGTRARRAMPRQALRPSA